MTNLILSEKEILEAFKELKQTIAVGGIVKLQTGNYKIIADLGSGFYSAMPVDENSLDLG